MKGGKRKKHYQTSPFTYIFSVKSFQKKAKNTIYLSFYTLKNKVSISSTFYLRLLRQYFYTKKFQSQNVTREKLRKALFYQKFSSKMLMKLTPGGCKKFHL